MAVGLLAVQEPLCIPLACKQCCAAEVSSARLGHASRFGAISEFKVNSYWLWL